MKNAIGYLRVSGQSQASDGSGLDEQRDAIALWAVRNDYVIVDWFVDAGVTGEVGWEKRPAMKALVERLATNGVQAVICHMLDRIGRGDSRVFQDFFDVCEASHVQLWSVTDGLLTVDPDKDAFQNADFEMIRSIKMAIVRQEKRKLVARMALGRARAKAAGKHTDGQWHYGHDPKRFEEREALALMMKLRKNGATFYGVMKELNARGIKPRSAEKWKEFSVKRIILREEEKLNGGNEQATKICTDGEGNSSQSQSTGEAQGKIECCQG